MGVRIIRDTEQDMSSIYDSVTDTSFGPVFTDSDGASEFLEWWNKTQGDADPRTYTSDELEALVEEWQKTKAEA